MKTPQEKIRSFIKKNNYTQKEFVKLIQKYTACSQPLISLWLSEKKSVSSVIAYGIQRASKKAVTWEEILRNQLYNK